MKTQRHTRLPGLLRIDIRTVLSFRMRELRGYFRDIILSTHYAFLSVCHCSCCPDTELDPILHARQRLQTQSASRCEAPGFIVQLHLAQYQANRRELSCSSHKG